jgi:hypothetical protein
MDPQLNRWLWLVKWLLAIPHYLVLVFLWLAFCVLSVFAFFAIIFTGRYPRAIFDFNVGVLRWSWRVAYYAYGVLGTDRYPPFTLAEAPDYPAQLSIDYPEHLSRGLVWVKSWLLAIPHYVVIGFFVGGTYWATGQASSADRTRVASGGLIAILVLVAAVVLLVTGRYPPAIFDLVLGLNRWVLRVAAYAALMTDRYPPFRLDLGGADPAPGDLALGSATGSGPGSGAVAGTGTAAGSPASGSVTPRSGWTGGRVVGLVIGCIGALFSLSLLAGAGAVGFADHGLRGADGYLMSHDLTFDTSTYALTSDNLELHVAGAVSSTPRNLLGDVRIRVRGAGTRAMFVGIAPTSAVDHYLSGVAHAQVVDVRRLDGRSTPTYRETTGGSPAAPPSQQSIWDVSRSGTGPLTLTWTPRSGDWTVVVMNADAGQGVHADAAAGATLPVLGWLAPALLVLGVLGMGVSAFLVLFAVRGASRPEVQRGQPV